MDSQEGSSSMRDSVKLDCDDEKARSCVPCDRGGNQERESVFTTTSGTNDTPQNGPRTVQLNSISSSESGQSSKISELSSYRSSTSGSLTSTTMSGSTSIDHHDTPRSSKVEGTVENNVELELQTCQRHKVCMDRAGTSQNQPSTSGGSKSNDNNNSNKENRKRPSSLKLNRSNIADESSSDTENDDYSLGSEDGCIYTYRGGEHLADLPSSFFSLDMGLPLDNHLPILPNYQVPQQGGPNQRERNSRASSPDMDFLEMDFDPGPSCEVDTSEVSSSDIELEAAVNFPTENEPTARVITPEHAEIKPEPVPVGSSSNVPPTYDMPSTSQGVSLAPVVTAHSVSVAPGVSVAQRVSIAQGVSLAQDDIATDHKTTHTYYGPFITHINAKGEHLLVQRTMCHWPHTSPLSLHVSSGDLVSPRDMLNYDEEHERPLGHQINQIFDSANLSSALYHLNMAKNLLGDNTSTDEATQDSSVGDTASSSTSAPMSEPPRCMVWSEREAAERQVTQIATSACGATAVVNVFIALGVPVNIDKINSAVGTRQRANNAPLPRYLLSRAVAGCTAADLVAGIQRASDGLAAARFFPTYPERAVALGHWLADWISLGAVPILTQNLQVVSEGEPPDAWHHQMVFGVSPRGIYLSNPLECVRAPSLWARLVSPSTLLVRARDVSARVTPHTDLAPLTAVPDHRFHTYNVLGQVVNVIREWQATGWVEQGTRTRHIRIPASYQAGITIAVLTGSEAHRRLMLATQLPIIGPQTEEK